MKCAILQPLFLPWRGAFHILKRIDKLVIYDDVQYDKRGWRNRNKIKTINGTQWLTVPIISKGLYLQSIKDTKIDNKQNWRTKIINSINHS